jgi:hypothetical protein
MSKNKLIGRGPAFESPPKTSFQKIFLAISLLIFWLALGQYRQQITTEGLIESSLNFRAALYAGYFLLTSLAAFLMLSFTQQWRNIEAFVARQTSRLDKARSFAPFLLLIISSIYLYLLLGFYGLFFMASFTRLGLFLFISVLVASLLSLWKNLSWWNALAISSLSLAALHNAALFLQQVNSYPLSLGWSEISRYYQASFYFSESVYGKNLALPITHPSRYLLQSLPFLIESLPLWAHRLWQALLWISMAGITVWAFTRRYALKFGWRSIAIVLWVYLYLMQGAVFYHLLPCVFIVLFTFDSKRLGRSLAFVLLASIWAGISRVNWLPLPGALAALLYLTEQPLSNDEKPLSLGYWWQPALYFISGSLTALISYWIYIRNSGVPDLGQFSSSFTSNLLWNRFWPNDAFPAGILPGILIVSLPLILLIYLNRQTSKAVHPFRWWAIALILVVFFGGGLIVSVKIGGGTNLHNMDTHIVLLLVLVAQYSFGRFALERSEGKVKTFSISWTHTSLLIAVPILFAVLLGGPLELPDRALAERAIEQIQVESDRSLAAGTEVLFISQRHMITFRMVDTPLVHNYEKLFLMEMAISHNDPYLLEFQKDINEQRFGLIVTDPLFRIIREDDEDSLAAENNEWVRLVSRPILCAYKPIFTYTELRLELLEPRYGSKCDQ